MEAAERAKVLVQRLLAFARRQPLQSTAIDVANLVTGMAELMKSTTGPQINLVTELGEAMRPAFADVNQLEMALLNLCVNARDAMPNGGTLRVSASEMTICATHRSKLCPGTYICLSVADTGTGMDEGTIARAVEPFFSTKGIGKGTGLGLSMVHGLASQLGGALTIQSQLNVGTNVELWLPVSETAPFEPDAGHANQSDVRSAGKVLLVDDEELIRLSTADMLENLGYEVTEAASAEEAIRLVRGGMRPNLLVTDHLMPGLSGTELARTLRAEYPGTKVLIVSGYADAEGVAPDLPRLTKPFRKDELEACLAVFGASSQ
jgi:CheY-like chemotaxis protein